MSQRELRISTGLMLLVGAMFAQAPAANLVFEVASIKPALPFMEQAHSGKIHAGMSIDGARVDIGGFALSDLIRTAYDVKAYQISGPNWMNEQRFDVIAKMPEGAAKEQVPGMLKALLADRFKLEVHRESREHAVYALVVGKNGPKLKESPPDDPAPNDAAVSDDKSKGGMIVGAGTSQSRITSDGKNTVINGGKNGTMRMSMGPNGVHMEAMKITLANFAEMISRFVDRPVVDMTELKGNYQIALDLSMEDLRNVAAKAGVAMPGPGGAGAGDAAKPGEIPASDPSGGSIFTAVAQLGLKLEARKAPVEVIVVDHLEKAPSEN